jgi:transcription-repair coupling factor (superfamily II helicase)
VKKFKHKIFQSEKFFTFSEELKRLKIDEPIQIQGIAGSLLAFLTAMTFESEHRQVLLVASGDDRAEKLSDDCALLLGEINVRFFGVRPLHHADLLDASASIAQIETLKALTLNSPILVVASPRSIVEKVPSKETFGRTIIDLQKDREYHFQVLLDRLMKLGFERKDFVEGYGDFAVRGGILDVFSFVGDNPLRFEFWGNTIESIREFDVLSQRSIRELQSASIVPLLSPDLPDCTNDAQIAGDVDKEVSNSLFDYLQHDAIVLLDEPAIIKQEIDELFKEGAAKIFTYEEFSKSALRFPLIINSFFNSNDNATLDSLQDLSTGADPDRIRTARHPLQQLDFQSSSQPSFNGSINVLVETLQKYFDQGYSVCLVCDSNEEAARLKELIEEVLTAPEKAGGSSLGIGKIPETLIPNYPSSICPEFLTEAVHAGFIYPNAKLALFTEHEIFGRLKCRGDGKRRRFKGFSHKELQQLKRGDYVVHVDHGIGEFAGLTKIRVGSVEQEVIKILFLENDVLYVNLSFVDRVQKYSSHEGHVPKLTKLGAPDWERMKSKAKRCIKDIARDLIALYSKRKGENGTAFSPDSHWQKELEASFMYEDTVDQTTATFDVKRDMESSSPMDRLICGDVGFGKTEVAVRAAFKAVMDGKQVAILVPTTILALQHYNTFLDRLNRYTTRVENITRFKSKKDQSRIVKGIQEGSIDIIIGTHRLLSKDIGFKDLGLLIIDEEHRFGVSAKEKLRQLKASVDTLALTATPIPRTLHFSLIGARDLSLINTPPRNRIPIITEIIPGSDGRRTQWHIIREAILKELHRGGQIYFVHDRVQNIDAIAEQVKSQVPEARVHVAHGQMTGHQLEKAMLNFLEKNYDVLVCTKIIESGLDIPNVNTIIINRADRFGLAELYQLRGRVGRSNVQAYAYLLIPPLSVMPKQTLRRLQAIEEFTELGSGFNLAMRDLEIRGAGNLLGAEQSGFIMEMGFEMYERIVREAVEELKHEEFSEVFSDNQPSDSIHLPPSIETVIETDIEALIPDFYIESDTERLDIYRRLYRAVDENELRSTREELRDRFGEYPEEVENLFQLVEVRMLACRAGFPKVSLKGQTLTIVLPDESNKQFYVETSEDNSPFQRLVKKISQEKKRDVQLKQIGKELALQFILSGIDSVKERIEEAKKKMEEFACSITLPSKPGSSRI